MVSENYMKALTQNHGEKAAAMLNEYIAFAYTLGFHKNVQDQLPEEFQQHAPDRDLLRPLFAYIPKKERRNNDDESMSGSEDHLKQREEELAPEVKADIDAIQELLRQKEEKKGDLPVQLSALLKNLKSDPSVHRAILVETLLFKYAMTFEHTMHFIKRIRPVLEEIYLNNPANQVEAVNYILKAYNLDDLSTQNF